MTFIIKYLPEIAESWHSIETGEDQNMQSNGVKKGKSSSIPTKEHFIKLRCARSWYPQTINKERYAGCISNSWVTIKVEIKSWEGIIYKIKECNKVAMPTVV